MSGYPVDWSKYPTVAARVEEKKLSAEAQQYAAAQAEKNPPNGGPQDQGNDS